MVRYRRIGAAKIEYNQRILYINLLSSLLASFQEEDKMKIRYLILIISFISLCIFPISKAFSDDPGIPDTLRFGEWDVHVTGPPYTGEVTVPVIVFNDEPIQAVMMPFKWSGPMSMDTLYFAGGRTDVFDHVGCSIDTTYEYEKLAWIWGTSYGDPMPPGTGVVVYLHFTVYDTGWAEVDSALTSLIWLHFTGVDAQSWRPQVEPRQYHITACSVGDVNCDGQVDVGDVVFLINYLYKGGLPSDFIELGDVNGDSVVDAGDVVYLINYLYRDGPPPL
jgi:hypothetical protein